MTSKKMMRAVYVRKFGGIDQLNVEKVAVPSLQNKQVLIHLFLSSINPIDTYIREGAFPCLPKLPYVPGVDGAGIVEVIGKKVSRFKVIMKVCSSGVNPVDTYIREGRHKLIPELPYIPGKDGAGIIHDVQKNSAFKPGDRVFSCQLSGRYGTLAEYCVVAEENVFPLNEKLKFEEGAAIGVPYFTAYRALFQLAKAKKSDRILVHGASGGVGLAAVQMAKNCGMHVVGTAGTKDGLDLVKEQGADCVYNHRENNYIEKMVNSEGRFDVILEMLANANLPHDIDMMNSRGRTVVIGCRGDVTISPRGMMGPETSIIGCALFSSTPEEWQETGKAIVNWIEAGWVKPIIDQLYTLEQASEAHNAIINSKGAKGNLIVNVQE